MMLDNIYGIMPVYINNKNPKDGEEGDDKWTNQGGNIGTIQINLILSIFSVA